MQSSYDMLIERIARASGKSREEIERLVEAKRAKLSGLVSKEGAAQIVAAELGVNFEKERVKIAELMHGMKRVNVLGKIIKMFPVRTYTRNEREHKLASFILADETGNIRTVLWDTNHIALIEQGKIKEGDTVEITRASVRNNELHLTGLSDIKLSQEILEEVKTEISYAETSISSLRPGMHVKLRATVVQLFEPRNFMVCPECRKRVSEAGECEEHGKVVPEKRALLSMVIDDGTGVMRAVLFNEQAEMLGIDLEAWDESKRQELLGEELIFSGSVRQNKLSQELELFVQDIAKINVEELIQELEAKTRKSN